MALKAMILRSKLSKLTAELEALRAKDADFVTREAELEAAINEMTAETSEEDRALVEGQIENFETEKAGHEEAKGKLEEEIERIDGELKEEEERAAKAAAAAAAPEKKERGTDTKMEIRTKFYGMNVQERDAFFAREDVKTFLGNVRTAMKEKRALNNVGLAIPEVMLDLIKEKAYGASKLLSRVNLQRVSGTARAVIMGTVPEAIWTEQCAKLNELDLGFNDVEVDGYKVGGYFAICNAILEDNDVNLATELIDSLGYAMAKALDKAVVYGTDVKMPMGIVTRLAQAEEPEDYPTTAREWKNLADHIITGTGKTGVALFQEIVTNTGVIDNDYSDEGLVWLMNKKTHTKLLVQSMEKNLVNGSIVAGVNNTMPVIGGDIIELPFIPDDNIVAGYMKNYLLAERAGTQLAQSEHYQFVEDRTVFKGTARYDGIPAIPEAFMVMTLSTVAPTTSVEFAPDNAN